MGTYLNSGNTRFKQAIESEIYRDKTDLIMYINSLVLTEQKYVCVSRPRRFGKTITANMLAAYYDRYADSRELFENKKIATDGKGIDQWDEYLGKFDVVKIIMTDFVKKDKSAEEMLKKLQLLVMRDVLNQYSEVDFFDREDLIQSMSDVYVQTGHQFVIIIDEWDAIFRENKSDAEGQRVYLDFLRDWLKDKDYVALAYMTGILPIKKYGKHSALNMFDEYSMIFPMQMAKYTGFTDDEVEDLCNQYGRNHEEIKNWYDGYEMYGIIPPKSMGEQSSSISEDPGQEKWSIYSPLSVVKAIQTGRIQNYWNQTETYQALSEYICRNYDGLKEDVAVLMAGNRISVAIDNYQNDMTTFHSKDDIFTLLIHLGYLAYDINRKEVYIPNNEILAEFEASTKQDDWNVVFKALENSQKLLEATWKKDAAKVSELVEKAHDKANNKTYNSEAALSYAIQLAYYNAQNYYTLIQEMDTGKGYADLVYIPSPKYSDKPVLLIELKYDKDAATAIDQIRKRNYPDNLEKYKGNIIIVGINYENDASSKQGYKHHDCLIEEA
ncbi:PD-(D/E)XK nuclease superfamily protein [Butyrivibrio proteoclasticus]|uniref:PD-(D/E)XK nuclease superfamily protein n=1 Tax=Butyrivibrio proteoclasticus TaxID=43305 RepID=A0A1I5PS81_9FIRM|nr:AAA family ATPase [Butyrivibrio proteoclasticus]SFP36844.1 PD-(D/E)XK nuclease superfamily protein [Butyrivibrio proteoclasticus]